MLTLSLAFAFISGQSPQHFQYLADLLTHFISFFFEMHGTSFFHVFICYVIKVYFLQKWTNVFLSFSISIHFRRCYIEHYYIYYIYEQCVVHLKFIVFMFVWQFYTIMFCYKRIFEQLTHGLHFCIIFYISVFNIWCKADHNFVQQQNMLEE